MRAINIFQLFYKIWKRLQRTFSNLFYASRIPILSLIFIFSGLFQPYNKENQHTSLTTNNSYLTNGYSSNQVIVKFSSETSSEIKKRSIRRVDAKVIGEIPVLGVTILQVPDGVVQKSINELLQESGVIYAEPNYFVEATDIIPNDPGWGNQYNLTAIHAPSGWELNTGAVWVTIAIVDSGVDLTHPDLFVRILPGYDFVNNDNDPQDDNGHGTHVAAIAAASSNNAVGISGVNWGANILPIKVLDSSGNGTYSNVANGIVWATDQGAQVINLSLGGGSPSSVLSDAVDYAYNHGVMLIASTGNAGAPAVLYPAAYSATIAVGATDSTNTWAGFSNYGTEVDVVAPGANIYSAYLGGAYGYRSGTSLSAPHVSGLAAILWGIPGNSPDHIRMLIESTSLDLGYPGWDEFYGFGLIQMDAAIQQALPIETPTPLVSTSTPSTEVSNEMQQEYVPLFPTGTFTYTSTATPLLITGMPLSPTVTNEAINFNASETPTATPLNQERLAGETDDNWWIACLGVFLIFIGALLFWLTTRKRKNKYLRKSF